MRHSSSSRLDYERLANLPSSTFTSFRAPSTSMAVEFHPDQANYKTSHLPGPGHYDIHIPRDRRGVLFGTSQRQFHPVSPTGPGPASYRPSLGIDSSKKTFPAFSFGHFEKVEVDEGPAPNSYNPDDRFVSPAVPAFSFGHRIESPKDMNIPGPASYVPIAKLKGSAALIGTRPGAPAPPAGPGPGKYFGAIESRKRPAFSFGHRTSDHLDDIPGMGVGTFCLCMLHKIFIFTNIYISILIQISVYIQDNIDLVMAMSKKIYRSNAYNSPKFLTTPIDWFALHRPCGIQHTCWYVWPTFYIWRATEAASGNLAWAT